MRFDRFVEGIRVMVDKKQETSTLSVVDATCNCKYLSFYIRESGRRPPNTNSSVIVFSIALRTISNIRRATRIGSNQEAPPGIKVSLMVCNLNSHGPFLMTQRVD